MVFTRDEIIIMIGVVSVLLFCLSVLTILDIREYLKAKKSLATIDDDFKEEYQEDENKIEPVQVIYEDEEKPLDAAAIVTNNSDDILLEEMDDEKFEFKEEATPMIVEEEETFIPYAADTKNEVNTAVTESFADNTLPKENEEKKIEIFEELDELEEKLPNKLDDITNFEMEQERTAIISLDELLKKSDELYNDNEFVQYDEGNEPITIDEVISRFRKESEPVAKEIKENHEELQVAIEDAIESKEPYSKKETIPFISSVYGIEKDSNALEFENTATYEKLDRESYNDFVAKLREMDEKE